MNCCLGYNQATNHWQNAGNEPLPLVALEAPCVLRTLACSHLDRAGIPWRIAFVSPSLGGLWAATVAGLGIALRTKFGRPAGVHVLDAARHGLPDMPSPGLCLLWPSRPETEVATQLAAIIRQALHDALTGS
ncbi:hypothetical protein [Granulibacter bethesdensis]|uniref:hypothetical protein n=1 Tax=Granulibacter bethesdensis TaxID=364410 RepID=UPI0020A3DAC0|nr:hypothetical protein [Granulibacter bethesdensis]